MIHWYYTVMKVCPWHLDTFYANTVLLGCKDEPECQLKALKTLDVVSHVSCKFCNMLMYFLNISLSIDFIMMLRYPFKSNTNRERILIACSFLAALSQLWLGFFDYKHDTYYWVYFMVSVGIVSVLLLIFTIFYVIFKLRKDSISKDIVSVIFKRHLLQIVAVLLCDAYSWVGYVYFILYPELYDDKTGLIEVYGANPPIWLCILKIFYIYPGFIMPLVRLSEPLFYKIIWQ